MTASNAPDPIAASSPLPESSLSGASAVSFWASSPICEKPSPILGAYLAAAGMPLVSSLASAPPVSIGIIFSPTNSATAEGFSIAALRILPAPCASVRFL